jgi:hypothetical protein
VDGPLCSITLNNRDFRGLDNPGIEEMAPSFNVCAAMCSHSIIARQHRQSENLTAAAGSGRRDTRCRSA